VNRLTGANKVQTTLIDDTCDDHFAHIAGFTSEVAPNGITWEEMKGEE
jgi:hypothetical protein